MADRQRWRPILFDCPRTGQKVQGLVAEEAFVFDTGEPRYETVSCIACGSVHFVEPASGSVLGAPRSRNSRR